jgi:hypothetical protein
VRFEVLMVVNMSITLFWDVMNHTPKSIIVSITGVLLSSAWNFISNKKFWEELIAYFPLIGYGPQKMTRPTILLLLQSNSSSIVAFVFVAVVMFLPSPCLARIGGYTYRHTDQWEGFMKYAIEVGSGAMIYIPSFIKTRSVIQK